MKLSTIALRYLKGQKKHTAISIIAVTISVALLTVLLSGVSVYRASALNAARSESGTYHVLFNGLNKTELVTLKSMTGLFSETENYSVSTYTSSTDINFGQNTDENASAEYLVLDGQLADDVFLRIKPEELTMLPADMRTVTEGRLPEKDGEIVISAASAYMWNYPQVGDTVSASIVTCGKKNGEGIISETVPAELSESFDIISENTVTFTVTGLSEEYNFVHYTDTKLRSVSTITDNMLARYSEKADDLYWDMHYTFADAGYEIDDFDYSMNQELLNLEGKGTKAKFTEALFFGVVYLAVLFIMFCVRLVIDNAFEISAKERIRQFGLLKAVGASKKQILKLTLWEAFFLAVPGVIMGILLGTGCAAGIFAAIKDAPILNTIADSYNTANMLVFELRPYVFITSAVIGVLWVCVSAVATGMRSIKASPVDAMRGADRYEKISVTRKPSGIEKGRSFTSAYSSLSVKRNRKRYIITMLSMILSITLFAGFSYGLDIYSDKLEREYDQIKAPYGFTVNCESLSPYYAANSAYEMRSEQCFENVQFDSSVVIYGTAVDLGMTNDGNSYLAAIHPVNENTYNKYIKSADGVTYEELYNSGKILLCANMGDKKIFDKAPEKISGQMFMMSDWSFGENIISETAGLYTTENRVYNSDVNITAIMAEEAYVAFTDSTGGDSYVFNYTAQDGTEYRIYCGSIYADAAKGSEKSAEGYLEKHFYGSYDNNLKDAAESRSLLEIIKLGGYFVIGIISLIAAVNIVNIISANVINRISELAMLRACGMTDKQLHMLILREGFSYAAGAGIVSAILTAMSVLLIKLPFMTHFHDLYIEDIGLELSPAGPLIYVLAAMPAAFLIAAAASFLPARRIINSPIVSNIRSREQV